MRTVHAQIQRLVDHPKDGMFGSLSIDDMPICWTLEPPWQNNQKNISCVPAAVYACERYISEKFGAIWRVLNVPFRSNILFHVGNVWDRDPVKKSDTDGCILPGMRCERINGKRTVQESRIAMQALLRETEGYDGMRLTIVNPF